MQPRISLSLRVMIVASMALASVAILANPQPTLAYNCYPCTGHHYWNGYTDGGVTHFPIRLLNGTDTNGQPSSILMRLRVSSAVAGTGHFVEAGVRATRTQATHYYWQDRKPNGSSSLNYIAAVGASHLNHGLWVSIWRNPGASWTVDMTSANWSLPGHLYSTPNLMSGQSMLVGTEMRGTVGLSQPGSSFTRNAYRIGSTNYYQMRPYPAPGDYTDPTQSGIITVYWSTRPSTNPSVHPGGNFWVSVP